MKVRTHKYCEWFCKQRNNRHIPSWLASRFMCLFRNLIGPFCCSRMLSLARVTDLFPFTGFLALDSGFMYFSRNLIGPFCCSGMLWLARVTDLPPVTQWLYVFFAKSDWSILVSVHTPIYASNANRSISLCLQMKLWRWMSMTVIWKHPGTLKELQKH